METRHLPALPSEAERTGYRILATLDRLGYVRKNGDGYRTVRFSDAALFGSVASYRIDAGNLYKISVFELSSARTVEQIGAVLGKSVLAYKNNGDLMYLVRMRPPNCKPIVPAQATLNLDDRPVGELLVPIGAGAGGDVWHSLPDLGHTLVVGTTGSGKSTFLHAALAALLSSATPERLQVTLADPKRSELTIWQHAPHVDGVAFDVDGATNRLAHITTECDRRGEMFAGVGARDITAYNERADEPLPYILVIVDEGLDLLLDAGQRSELTAHIKTLAMRGRSAGIFLWIASQHATAISGVPRVVGVNLTTRIVFRVADRSAADVIRCPGAQDIPKSTPGRMLARLDGEPVELQGFYLDDAALEKVAGEVSKPPTLSADELALIEYAEHNLGGDFVVNKLAGVVEGWTSHRVKKLAQDWERKGWLTKPRHAADARKITPALSSIARTARRTGCV